MSEAKRVTFYSCFVWGLAILFFFYEFFLRVMPATMAGNIMEGLNVSVEQFSMLGSAYYITYSFMQIPVGLLLDRFSARLLITVAAALCSFGALWFGFAHGFGAAFAGRLLIGFGSSFGFVSLMIATMHWFPKKYFAFLTGCGMFLGAIGPLCAGAPIAFMLEAVDNNWRVIFFGVALFGVALTLLIGLFFRDKPEDKSKIIFIDRKEPLARRVKSLLKLSQIWWILITSGLIYVALPLLGAFWGTSYLETRGFSKPAAAFIVSMIWVGFAVANPLFGRLSDKIKRRKTVMAASAVVGLIGSVLLLVTPSENEFYLGALFFLIGMAGAGQNLAFAIISEITQENLRATAFGLNNTALMGFAAILPPFVTSIIQYFAEDGKLTEQAFEKGFLVLPVAFALAFLIILFGIKETFCRQQNAVHSIVSGK